ncbi:MAG: hypothetical protein V1702_02460 [Candidatus Woesearchaeota archaeon]
MLPIIDQDILLAEDARLVKKLYKVQKDAKYPEGLRFSYQYLALRADEWKEVCRIDNYSHEKRKGSVHIHRCGRCKAEFKHLNSTIL